jgi:hypothetical protein
MAEQTLLQKAMARDLTRRSSKLFSQDERELALAWADGTITITQVAAALGAKTGAVYPFLAHAMRKVYLDPS